MGHAIGYNRMGAPADRHFCWWPTCDALSSGYPLCSRHQLKVYEYVRADLEWVKDQVETITPSPDSRHGWVYFVRYRDRVKIGYSIDPQTRIKALPFDEVLAIVPGGREDEKRAHAAFAHLRENGEWFRAEDDLLAFARDVGSKAA